ncbi:abcG22 [Scenedesmus sp. PABB004]|nr:abcG22 [Scenedesmus sp. PABB004]
MADARLWAPAVVLAHAIALALLARAALRLWPGRLRRRRARAGAAARAAPSSDGRVAVACTRTRPALAWRELSVAYGMACVLRGVSGAASPGELGAILGPSGAGKSHLLDVLAGRKATGSIGGAVLLGGRPASARELARRVRYVPQDDVLLPTLTAAEVLLFAAAMQLPRGPAGDGSQLQARAAGDALAAVGLAAHGGTLVGGRLPGGLLLRGLSGGERRRLAIAGGLLGDPDAVLLDEPTSGLDSAAALSVVGQLRGLARAGGGRVILAAIHQPRSAIWGLFDSVTLLAQGRLTYHGATAGLAPWLSGQLGRAYDPAAHGLASDWALDLVGSMASPPELEAAAAAFAAARAGAERGGAAGLPPQARTARLPGGPFSRGGSGSLPGSDGAPDALDQQRERQAATPATLAEAARVLEGLAAQRGGGKPRGEVAIHVAAPGSDAATDSSASGDSGSDDSSSASPQGQVGGSGGGAGGGGYPASWWQQFRALVWRETLVATRNPAEIAGRLLVFVWVALMVSAFFYDLPAHAGSVRLRLNLLFSSLCFLLLMPYVVVHTPLHALTALAAVLTQYGLAGLRPGAGAVSAQCAVGVLTSLVAVQARSAAARTRRSRGAAARRSAACRRPRDAPHLPPRAAPVNSGFFIAAREIRAPGLSNLRFLAAAKWSLEAMATAELGGRRFPCPPPGAADPAAAALLGQLLPGGGGAAVAALGSDQGGCAVDGGAVLDYFFGPGPGRGFGFSMAILAANLAGLHALTLAALVLVARRERR